MPEKFYFGISEKYENAKTDNIILNDAIQIKDTIPFRVEFNL